MLERTSLHQALLRANARHRGSYFSTHDPQGRVFGLREFQSIRNLKSHILRFEASKVGDAASLHRLGLSRALDRFLKQIEVREVPQGSDLSRPNSLSFCMECKGHVSTEFQMGQGLGNQLWAYAVALVNAARLKVPLAVTGEHNYKGRGILTLDFGHFIDHEQPAPLRRIEENRSSNPTTGLDVSGPDPRILNLAGYADLSGNLQSYSYIAGYEDLIRDSIRLSQKPLEMDENVCVVHFRAGDFLGNRHSLGLGYYLKAMAAEMARNPSAQFVLVSDQPAIARRVLSGFDWHSIEAMPMTDPEDVLVAPHHHGKNPLNDFLLLFSAKSVIIPNSSFSWWASFLSLPGKRAVWAPEYWAGHNEEPPFWSTSDIATPGFHYISPGG